MTIPTQVREELKRRLWEEADRIGWANLSAPEKAKRYEQWTMEPSIGGLLARYMDKGRVRVYLKDSLLKGYARTRLADATCPLRAAGVPEAAPVAETYVKPHGRRLADGRVICWGRAEDWKLVLMAVHERAFAVQGGVPFAAILMGSIGRFHEDCVKSVVEDAANKLGIRRLVWMAMQP